MRHLLVASLAVMLGASACGDNEEPVQEEEPRPSRTHREGGSSWTVLVYLLADNDLEAFALDDLEEMMAVGSANGFTLLVQADRARGLASGSVGGLPDWHSTKRLRVAQGKLLELEDLGEANMGDPAVLEDFIVWGAAEAPADRFALILWDHGNAWRVFGADFGSDLDGLTLPELSQALDRGLRASGIGELSLVGIDACLMGSYETAAVLSPFAEYLIASEELEPGHGWDYRAFSAAATDPAISPVALGKQILRGFREQARKARTEAFITLSLVDLYELELLEDAVAALASGFRGSALEARARAVGVSREAAMRFGDHPDPERAAHMIDLGGLTASLAGTGWGAAKAASNRLAKVVIERVNGDSRREASGLSIYFPPHRGLYRTEYAAIPRVEPWRRFLDAYFEAGGRLERGPRFLDPDHVGTLSWEDGALVLVGELAPETAPNVVEVSLVYGTVDAEEDALLLGDRPGGREGSLAYGAWDATFLVVEQAGAMDLAYMSLTIEEDGLLTMGVPFVYTAPGEDPKPVILVVVFDAEGDELSRSFYAESGGAWGELAPVPGSALQTLVLVLPATAAEPTWSLAYGDTFDPAGAFNLSLEPLSSGTGVFLLLTATDYGGNSDYVFNGGTLP